MTGSPSMHPWVAQRKGRTFLQESQAAEAPAHFVVS